MRIATIVIPAYRSERIEAIHQIIVPFIYFLRPCMRPYVAAESVKPRPLRSISGLPSLLSSSFHPRSFLPSFLVVNTPFRVNGADSLNHPAQTDRQTDKRGLHGGATLPTFSILQQGTTTMLTLSVA